MRRRPRWRSLAGGVALAATAVACGDKGDSAGEATSGAIGPVELPFGLEQVDGTEPIGRPAVFDDPRVTDTGERTTSRALEAIYRVTAADPVAVVRAWAEQLDQMALTELEITAVDRSPGHPWIEVRSGPDDDWVHLQLWSTGDGPMLLVSLDRHGDDPPREPAIVDEAGC